MEDLFDDNGAACKKKKVTLKVLIELKTSN
jgi:hypothetical protein